MERCTDEVPQAVPQAASWIDRAASLGERRAALAGGQLPEAIDEAEIDELVASWRRRLDEDDPSRLDRRLAALGLTIADVGRLAGVGGGSGADWVPTALAAQRRARELGATLAAADDAAWAGDAVLPFASLWTPWVACLDDRLARFPRRRHVLDAHRSQLAEIGTAAAHALWESTERHDVGSVGYRRWILDLLDAGLTPLLDRFPVLGRLLSIATDHAAVAMTELFEHLADDRAALVALGVPVAADLVDAVPMGDSHHGGRQVMMLRFGGGEQLVYKPRSLQPESTFTAVVDHLAGAALSTGGPEAVVDAGLDVALTPTMLDRGDHGWAAFVPSAPAADLAELQTFSRRAGAALAIAFATATTDLHIDNVLIAGDRPVLVDLECIATAPIVRAGQSTDSASSMRSMSAAFEAIHYSVLDTYLLPLTHREERLATDNTGLTGVEGRLSGTVGRAWVRLGTAELAREPRPFRVTGTSRRRVNPELPAVSIDDVDHGFRAVAALITSHGLGIDLTEPRWSRVVLSDTRTFGSAMATARRPDHLVDGLRHAIALDVNAAWAHDPVAPAWRRVAADVELASMERLDVPLATADWLTGDVTIDGHPVPGALLRPGVAEIERNVTLLAPARVHRQLDLLRIALEGRLGIQRRVHAAPAAADRDPVSVPVLTEVAERIAEQIERSSVELDDGSIQWLGIELRDDGAIVPELAGPTIYAGSAGTAIFLAALAHRTQSTRWADLALRAIGDSDVADDHHDGGEGAPSVSFAAGRSGWAYAAHHVGALLGDDVLVKRAVAEMHTLSERSDLPRRLDLMGGTTGVLSVAATMADHTGDEQLAEFTAALARTVRAEWEHRCAGHRVDVSTAQRLGLAHGITGTVLAMARAAKVLNTDEHRSFLLELIEVEDARIAARDGVASRLSTDGHRLPEATWCWGTSGFVLARTIAAESVGERAGAHVATARALSGELASDLDRFCCGTAGRLEALTPGSADHTAAVRRLVDRSPAWLLEERTTVMPASLFRGLAGVGYSLLRVVDPSLANVAALG